MAGQTASRILLSVAIGLAGAMAFSQTTGATPEISEKEGQGCLVCHTALGKPDLNDRGRFYKAERTLEGYEPADPPAKEAPAESVPGR